MSSDLHTLSGAYALDALSPEEVDVFDTHLSECPACRDEVRELREAAAQLALVESTAPPRALKARVMAAADRQRQLPPKVTSIQTARSRRWVPRVVGVAAALILAVTGTVLALNRSPAPTGPIVASESVSQVFQAPDARTATKTTANGGRLQVAISPERAQMAVVTQGLPALAHRTYQMWWVRNGHSTSVGVVTDVRAGKVMPIPAVGTTVAITIEPPGGSEQPTNRPVIELDPQDV